MKRVGRSDVVAVLVLGTTVAGPACSDPDSGSDRFVTPNTSEQVGGDAAADGATPEQDGASQLSARTSDQVEQNAARSTVTFADLEGAMSSQPIIQSVSENADGSARSAISYDTLIGEMWLCVYLDRDDPSDQLELPRMGSLVLSEPEGSWEALEGTVGVSGTSQRVTLVLDGIRLTSETAAKDRKGLSGVITGELEYPCFVRVQSDQPRLVGGGGAPAETGELRLDLDWESPFCKSQRPDLD
jgi:hypothetical protein